MGAYSVFVGSDRLGWCFRSLWAARLQGVNVCSASGMPVSVLDDLTGAVMWAFERDAGGRVVTVWEDQEAAGLTWPAGALVERVPA